MSQRIDKWLVYARFVKHRGLAQALVEKGLVRINRERVVKTSTAVKANDVVTLAVAGRVLVIRVVGEAQARGPASAARLLYEELGTADPNNQVEALAPTPDFRIEARHHDLHRH